MVMRGLGLVGEADGRASGSGAALLVGSEGKLCPGLGGVLLAGGAGGTCGSAGAGALGCLGGHGLTILGMAIGTPPKPMTSSITGLSSSLELLGKGVLRASSSWMSGWAGLGDRGQWAGLGRWACLGLCRKKRVGDVLHKLKTRLGMTRPSPWARRIWSGDQERPWAGSMKSQSLRVRAFAFCPRRVEADFFISASSSASKDEAEASGAGLGVEPDSGDWAWAWPVTTGGGALVGSVCPGWALPEPEAG